MHSTIPRTTRTGKIKIFHPLNNNVCVLNINVQISIQKSCVLHLFSKLKFLAILNTKVLEFTNI
uniref:Uncharacterized protein n=1 Tax=Anguilla anguilla TaxID=7936 RepID=A0A0E9PNA4_ANGAN